MKKIIFILIIFILIFSIALNCSKDESTKPEIKELTKEEQEVIEQTHETVSVTAD